MFSHPRTSINPFPYHRPTFTVPAVPRQPCRSCWKTITGGHSLHECLKEKRRAAQKLLDRQLERHEFISKNNLRIRSPRDPCISCAKLFGQEHLRSECGSIRLRKQREVDRITLFEDIRNQLGLNYTPIGPISTIAPKFDVPRPQPRRRTAILQQNRMVTIIIRISPALEATSSYVNNISWSIRPIHNFTISAVQPGTISTRTGAASLNQREIAWYTQGATIWARIDHNDGASFYSSLRAYTSPSQHRNFQFAHRS